MCGRTNQATNKCLGTKFKSFYLRVEGRTKSLTSALVEILSPTYGWKDEPSHLRVPWSKIKALLPTGGRTNRAISKCLGIKFKSFYLRVEGRTNSLTSALVEILSPTCGWKDEPSHSRVLWSKFKSSYLRVGGRTKPLTSAFVQNLSLSTYGWKDKPSHLRVPWLKIKALLPTGGRTNQAISKCLGIKFKSFYLRVDGRTKSLTSVLVEI